MTRLLIAAAILALAAAMANARSLPIGTGAFTNVSSVTFMIASSAKTSTPNLRIGVQQGRLAQTVNTQPIQGIAPNNILNYYLTKTLNINVNGATALLVDSDVDVKVYLNNSLGYLLYLAGSPRDLVIYK